MIHDYPNLDLERVCGGQPRSYRILFQAIGRVPYANRRGPKSAGAGDARIDAWTYHNTVRSMLAMSDAPSAPSHLESLRRLHYSSDASAPTRHSQTHKYGADCTAAAPSATPHDIVTAANTSHHKTYASPPPSQSTSGSASICLQGTRVRFRDPWFDTMIPATPPCNSDGRIVRIEHALQQQRGFRRANPLQPSSSFQSASGRDSLCPSGSAVRSGSRLRAVLAIAGAERGESTVNTGTVIRKICGALYQVAVKPRPFVHIKLEQSGPVAVLAMSFPPAGKRTC